MSNAGITKEAWTRGQYGRRLAAVLVLPPLSGWIIGWRNKNYPARAMWAKRLAVISTLAWLLGPLFEYATTYHWESKSPQLWSPHGAWALPSNAFCFPANSFANVPCYTHIPGYASYYVLVIALMWSVLYRQFTRTKAALR